MKFTELNSITSKYCTITPMFINLADLDRLLMNIRMSKQIPDRHFKLATEFHKFKSVLPSFDGIEDMFSDKYSFINSYMSSIQHISIYSLKTGSLDNKKLAELYGAGYIEKVEMDIIQKDILLNDDGKVFTEYNKPFVLNLMDSFGFDFFNSKENELLFKKR
jgi:hypothetical protein